MANEKRLIDITPLVDECEECMSIEWNHKVHVSWADAEEEFMQRLLDAPVVDAVEVADMKEFAEDVVYQFGYYCQNGGRLHITHGGLSTLEWAFDILGWENPHPVPECECEIEGCHEHATCGTPTADGYKRMCGRHYRNHCAKMDGDGNDGLL